MTQSAEDGLSVGNSKQRVDRTSGIHNWEEESKFRISTDTLKCKEGRERGGGRDEEEEGGSRRGKGRKGKFL